MKKSIFENVGIVYKFWYHFFDIVEQWLPYSIMRKYIFKNTTSFSDKWVVIHTIMSVVFMLLMYNQLLGMFSLAVVGYAFIRIMEIVVYQVNVLLFHPYKAIVENGMNCYELQSPYRSIVLLGHNFIEVIFWFTCMTEYFSENNIYLIQAIMNNTIRIFTFNYQIEDGGIGNVQIIFFIEVICGMLLTIISLAKFIGELPHVRIEVDEE